MEKNHIEWLSYIQTPGRVGTERDRLIAEIRVRVSKETLIVWAIKEAIKQNLPVKAYGHTNSLGQSEYSLLIDEGCPNGIDIVHRYAWTPVQLYAEQIN